MVFNRATIDDWKTKPSQARLLDVFVGQDQIEIRKGKMVRTRYRNVSTRHCNMHFLLWIHLQTDDQNSAVADLVID